MISIIICSKFSKLDEKLQQNIQSTIGCEYEIVHIDNSSKRFSIFEAYNLGVERAKGEFLCFMHEDVVFHSHNWGKTVEKHLSDDSVGALGIAGSQVVPPQYDWRFYGNGTDIINLLQGTYTLEESPTYYVCYFPHKRKIHRSGKHLLQVAIIDGVWMCFRKELFSQIRFDDKSFHSFHLYDSDISMQVNKLGKNLYVVTDILLEHKSEGYFSPEFEQGMTTFDNKWADFLPVVRGATFSKEEIYDNCKDSPNRYAQRVKYDLMYMNIRKLYSQRSEGMTVRDFTDEEMLFIKQSMFRYVKSTIKNKRIPLFEVFRVVKKQLRNPLLDHKDKLFWKFIWYRLFGVAYLI